VDPADLVDRLPSGAASLLGRTREEARDTVRQAGLALRYDTYVRRQHAAAARLERARHRVIPPGFRFSGLPGISREIQERLTAARPLTLDQAARLRGMTPAALQILDAHLAHAVSAGGEAGG
jgi:tRNA uridine 5-carboxymethylaminomethyl modification enzyme